MRLRSGLAPLALCALIGCSPEEDPFAVDAPRECTIVEQNEFVVEVMSEFYLWNEDVPGEVDLEAFESPEDLVRELRNDDDRWTRIRDKATSDALFMEGKFVGLGYKTLRMEDEAVRVSFVSDNSPASAAGIRRGDRIAGVAGRTAEELDTDNGWGAAYGPNEPGVAVDLLVERSDGTSETMTVTKDWIDIVSLPVVETYAAQDGGTVGYFVMDRFVETTKRELEEAFAGFQAAGVDRLVIDLRYNGGGLISVAALLVDLAVGADHGGEVAYRFEFNENLADENRSAAIEARSQSLGADEIVILTTGRTLSASELVINALRPYADVTLVGLDTGGKPVGSRSFEFCEKKLFPVTFRLVNATGETDYFEGLHADCLAIDDIFNPLGDPEEGMLAAALHYFDNDACINPAAAASLTLAPPAQRPRERMLPRAELRDEIDSW